jgi:ribose transport system substrate-binding protein
VSETEIKTDVQRGRTNRPIVFAVVAVLILAVAGCGSGAPSSGSTQPASKLILLELSFPCGLNDYAKNLCAAATDEGKKLSSGFSVDIKTGVQFNDNVAYNSLIQTSLQLHPAGLIIFPAGPAAQVPVLKQACAQGVKVIIIDSPASDKTCQSSFVGADHYQLGVEDGQWLIAHPPSSKEVGVVTLPPGEYASNDARVQGFTKTVQDGGFQVVAVAVTDLSLATTRTEVTNMLTAHPNISAIFSANSLMGKGTAQALLNNHHVKQLTLDGDLSDIPSILNGTLSADAAQDPYAMGSLAVRYASKAIQGQKVPESTYTPSVVVDMTNAAQYMADGGMH